MTASKLKLTIEQGATFSQPITWKAGNPAAPVDLTGCTARMQIRPTIPSSTVYASLTTENGGITLGGTAGTVLLTMTAVQTAALGFTTAVYDVEVAWADGTVRRIVYGPVTLSPEVTRA